MKDPDLQRYEDMLENVCKKCEKFIEGSAELTKRGNVVLHVRHTLDTEEECPYEVM